MEALSRELSAKDCRTVYDLQQRRVGIRPELDDRERHPKLHRRFRCLALPI